MNKRHLSRVGISEWASVSYYDQLFFGSLDNLSFQGLYFVTDHIIPLHTLVRVNTPYSEISLNANVVRQDQNGIGLKIVDIKLSAFLNLNDIISKNIEDKDAYMREMQLITLKLHPAKAALTPIKVPNLNN